MKKVPRELYDSKWNWPTANYELKIYCEMQSNENLLLGKQVMNFK